MANGTGKPGDDESTSEDFARPPGRPVTAALWLVGSLGLIGTRILAIVAKVLNRRKGGGNEG